MLLTVNWMSWPCHWLPNSTAAITTGISSLVAILRDRNWAGHCKLNHFSSQYAPHPQEPEASDTILNSVRSRSMSHGEIQCFAWHTAVLRMACLDGQFLWQIVEGLSGSVILFLWWNDNGCNEIILTEISATCWVGDCISGPLYLLQYPEKVGELKGLPI